jgi:CDP-glycerol glycerophosphotransferase (TagB/SpsB family)
MWSIDSWSHQFEAFDAMMTLLERRGVGLVLRLHPNLGSKSRAYFQREVADALDLQSRHPALVLHWHNSSVNSYDLVRHADYVIVERSTIGLEAILMGKPVWVTQASQWDQVADVRQVLSLADITGEIMRPWEVSRVGAQNFAAYWMVQEHPLRWDWSAWSTWDPGKAPLRMKIAVLAIKNPWRHRARLVRIEWTAWRNSKFRPPGQSAESQ